MPLTGHRRSIALRGGGRLWVCLEDVSWMAFGPEERALLSSIADALHAYESEHREEDRIAVPPVSEIAVVTPEAP